MRGTNADIRGRGGFVWSIAEILRGDFKQSKYGKVILPFIVLRRLNCLLDVSKQDVLKAAKGLSDAVDDPTKDMILFAAAGENTKVYNFSAFILESLKAQDPGQLHDNLIDYITKFGVRPYVRTGSLGGLDRMPGVLILELNRAQISERGVATS